MKAQFTPLHIQIIIHAVCMAEPWTNESPASFDFIRQLEELEMLQAEKIPGGWNLTASRKAEVWLDAIKNTPLPVLQYVMPTEIK